MGDLERRSGARPRRILLGAAIVAAVVAPLFVLPLPRVINPDSFGYFVYLPSLLYERSLLFLQPFRALGVRLPLAATPNGYVVNSCPVGPAFLWSPFYAAIAAAMRLSGANASGWEDPLWKAVESANWLYAALTLWAGACALRSLGLRRDAARATALAAAGTPLLFYSVALPTTSHVVSACLNAACLALTAATAGQESAGRWAALGLVAGLGTSVRLQNALALFFPASEWIAGGRARRSWVPPAATAAGFVAGFSPQLLMNRCLYGGWLSSPAAFNVDWRYFAPGKIAFSPYHGLLWWTPLHAVGLCGLVLALRRRAEPRWAYASLLAFAAADLLVASVCVSWWQGSSFGQRYSTGAWVAVAVGTAAWAREWRSRGRAGAWMGLGLPAACALWTLGLFFHATAGLDLERPLGAANVVFLEAHWLAGAGAFARALAAQPRVSTWLWLALAGTGVAALAGARLIYRRAASGRRGLLFAALGAWIAVFDAGILLSHWNRTAMRPRPGELMPYRKYGGVFLNYYLAQRAALR